MTQVVQLPMILITMMGDSIYALSNSAGPNAWSQSSIAALQSAFPAESFGLNNLAVGSTSTATHWGVASTSVGNTPGKCKLKFGFWPWWSGNDGLTAASMTASWNTYLSNFIALCRAQSFIPVLATCTPFVNMQAANDPTRVSFNAQIIAMASATPGSEIIVADFDAAISDHQTPVAHVPAIYSDGGTHPNTPAGQAAMWPVLSNAIGSYLNSISIN